jgi:hypothetical protein
MAYPSVMLRETGFEIARPTGLCSVSGRAITPGEIFVAGLFERTGEDRLERRDFSLEAWGAGPGRDGGPPGLVASWRAVMPRPDDRAGRLVDDEALACLFEQVSEAAEGESTARAAFRFLLALLLVRRRVLRHAGARAGAMLVRWTREGDTERPIEVADPGMDEATIAAATEQLSAVLRGAPPGEGATS